jgi:hypothetical protein
MRRFGYVRKSELMRVHACVSGTIDNRAQRVEQCKKRQGRPPLGKLGPTLGEQMEGVLDRSVFQQQLLRNRVLCTCTQCELPMPQ